MPKPNDLQRILAERTDSARRSFWSDDPLNITFRQETGKTTFSLREFIAFVIELPQEQFEACTAKHREGAR